MRGVLAILMMSSISARAFEPNCTAYPPYYLTDQEIVGFAYFQIASGVWSTVLMANNFIAAWYFYGKEERSLEASLKVHTKEIARENELIGETIEELRKAIGADSEEW